ncbi:hypothetical protein K458DRAFT_398625 [Lentithecium fluviatile CBS 122367]|uniref:Uncharacterized protein n=1 Tax=Lentithecium fluviatile CBS 122367 TaxID=1168545 RepID=A0A6G1JK63_9PLEO|nr:hypothetical protein K458DRAFT_398625 [Lentithecium fluviatile CBS 122367]
MASKLCCTVEQDERSDSPDLPNARVSEATPAKLPLLPKRPQSQNSHFTSARTDDLHELQQIFDNAKDDEARPATPRKVTRARFIRPSVYSLHSLHKMKSMHSIIRRKFSKDLSNNPSSNHLKAGGTKKNAAPAADDTVLKQSNDGPNLQLKITKDDLKKDLLSDKKPAEGGYDSDAEVLDDIAKNIGKKSPSKRPSVHSIEWTPSTTSKPTPGSSSKSRQSVGRTDNVPPYQIKPPQPATLSGRFSQVFSTPNFQLETAKIQERKLRRSHSATSVGLPQPSPLSPLRLPSLDTNDDEGVPWSVSMNESLRLAHFPIPPLQLPPKQSRASLRAFVNEAADKSQSQATATPSRPVQDEAKEPSTPATVVQIRVQEPTAATTPRTSTSVRGTVRENVPFGPREAPKVDPGEDQEGDDPRRSVHLYSMRISHHLRSGSLLSWDTLTDAPDLPNPRHALRDRSVSDLSRMSQIQKQLSRHERQTSSSGFASAKVPSKWGKVVPHEVREDKSSIYSSRPQSPPDSFGGSMVDLSRTNTGHAKSSSVNLPKPRRSNSYPTDNDDTPRPAQRYGLTGLRDVTSYSAIKGPSDEAPHLARNNSVASTKKSKFREEFSPSPPKKKLIPSSSIMRFLNPKRTNMRSQSEANIKPSVLEAAVDGLLEVPDAAAHRDRRQSKSLVSMETEQTALGKDKKASPMWERALKSHQDERAAMFLPQNKELAAHSSPIRERRGSTSKPRSGSEEEAPITKNKFSPAKRFSAPLLDPLPEPTSLFSRRTALFSSNRDVSPDHEVQMHFNRQTDDKETVGAWGRYPSHSRPERTLSAGHIDRVDSRDFALEAAINFAMGRRNDDDEDNIDPTERPPTPPLLPGEKRRKKKVGNTRMAKSNSMTFGKSFLKNYTKIFRSQSIEFHQHGHGHRSSIATGGTLEYPELEILPEVWRRGVIEERSAEHSGGSREQRGAEDEYGPGDKKGKGKLKEEDSTSTIRPLQGSRLQPTTSLPRVDGPADQHHIKDTARVWSAYYENCLPSYPRASTELDFCLEDFGIPARHSFESRRPSMHSRTLPGRLAKHSRNASHASARPSLISLGEDDGRIDERSIVSVRRSTMDLVAMYKEQENTERERVLGLMRMESRRGDAGLAGL